jgi:predicted MFS family arabinose efflux permease
MLGGYQRKLTALLGPLLSRDPLLLSSNSNRSLTKRSSAFRVVSGGFGVAEALSIEAPGGRQRRRIALDLGVAGWVPLLLLTSLATAQGFDVNAFGVLAPEIRHTFHLDNAGIDTVSSLTAAMPILTAIFIGYLGDRFDRAKLTRYFGVLWGVTAVLTGLAPVLALLVVARLLGGVGYMSTQTIYPSLLSDTYPGAATPQVFTVYLFGLSGLSLLGNPLAGWLGQLVGWRPTFVILAVPTFILVVLLYAVRDPGRGVTADQEPVTQHASSLRANFGVIRKIRTLRRIWVAAFLFGAGTLPLATLASNFFHDVYHLGSENRGWIIALIGVAALVGIVVGGAVNKQQMAAGRPGALAVVIGAGAAEAGIFALALALAPKLWMSVAAAFLLGLGGGCLQPAYATIVSTVTTPALRSQAYAWTLFFFALGAGVLTGFIGVVADAHGQRAAMALLALFLIVAGPVAASARRFVSEDQAAAA